MTLPADPHVCFVCPYIEPYLKPGSGRHVGGAERQQHLLAEHLRDAGWTVSFLTLRGDGDRYERIDGFDCWKTIPPTNDIRHGPAVLHAVYRSLRRIDADVFYVRGNPPLCILTSYCCRLLGERLVYVVANDSNVELARLSDHHRMFEHALPRLCYLDAIRRTDAVVAQTAHQHDILEDVFDIDATVIPNGYTVPDAAALTAADERRYVLWVGHLDPEQKQPERVFEIANRLPEVRFRMVGWTEDDAYRERFRDRLQTHPNVEFEGFVPPDEIDSHYSDAVALLNTSAYEGFPNTFLEAWRFGVPVVSLHRMLDGVLEREKIGTHAGTITELTRAVEALWNDAERAARMGRRGRQYLQSNYALEVIAAEYVDLFADVMAVGEGTDRPENQTGPPRQSR